MSDYKTYQVADVTRRLGSDDIVFVNGVRMVLLAGLDERKKVNLFFQSFCPGLSRPYDTYSVDTVLEMYELPDPAGNKQQWEKVRKLKIEDPDLSNDETVMRVALGNAIRKWRFSIEEEPDNIFALSIIVPRRSDPLEARVENYNIFKIV